MSGIFKKKAASYCAACTSAAVLAKNDIPEHVFQAHGAWKSREAMLVYIQRSLATKLQVTQVMGY